MLSEYIELESWNWLNKRKRFNAGDKFKVYQRLIPRKPGKKHIATIELVEPTQYVRDVNVSGSRGGWRRAWPHSKRMATVAYRYKVTQLKRGFKSTRWGKASEADKPTYILQSEINDLRRRNLLVEDGAVGFPAVGLPKRLKHGTMVACDFSVEILEPEVLSLKLSDSWGYSASDLRRENHYNRFGTIGMMNTNKRLDKPICLIYMGKSRRCGREISLYTFWVPKLQSLAWLIEENDWNYLRVIGKV